LHLGKSVTVVIPTYNEREIIESLLGQLIKRLPEVSIVVVDDSSPDGTGRMCFCRKTNSWKLRLLQPKSRRTRQGGFACPG